MGMEGAWKGFRAMVIYLPEEKLAVAYTSNGVVYPAQDIVRGVLEITRTNRSRSDLLINRRQPGNLEKYVGVYSSPGSPSKVTITRDGTSLPAKTARQSAFPPEETAADKFKSERARIVPEC